MRLWSLTSSIGICLIISGCASRSTIPNEIFEKISIYEKPTLIDSVEGINGYYLKLFESYQKNLLLLDTIQKLNQGGKK